MISKTGVRRFLQHQLRLLQAGKVVRYGKSSCLRTKCEGVLVEVRLYMDSKVASEPDVRITLFVSAGSVHCYLFPTKPLVVHILPHAMVERVYTHLSMAASLRQCSKCQRSAPPARFSTRTLAAAPAATRRTRTSAASATSASCRAAACSCTSAAASARAKPAAAAPTAAGV